MAVRSFASRYQNYSCPSLAVRTEQDDNEVAAEEPEQNRVASHNVCQDRPTNSHSNSSRLEYIINSMAYIRGELDDLKESDRVLLDIFKQLECNVAELSDSISSWKGGSSQGRPMSFTDMDFGTSRSSYYADAQYSFNASGLETILDSSTEDLSSYKPSNETDSLYLPEHDGSSHSCSPVMSSGMKSCSNIPSSVRVSAEPSPQLRTSTSFNNRLAHSPSITRLQDDTGSSMSRNSSIDSGIQFASEAENGSANGVEPMVVPPADETDAPDDETDVRKSVSFADDIFSALGL